MCVYVSIYFVLCLIILYYTSVLLFEIYFTVFSRKNWKKIKNDQIKPFKQIKRYSSFKKKEDVNKYDHIDLNKKVIIKDFINILRARSFGKKSFAYFEDEGKKVYINLTLNH